MRKKSLILVLASVCVLGLIVTAIVLVFGEARRLIDQAESEDNIKSILGSLLKDKGALRAEVFALTGRNFILASVANGALGPGEWDSVRYLWPPGSDLPQVSEYEQVTWESLEGTRFAHLTGYAGPINARSAPTGPEGVPLIADLTRSDGIIVGFSSFCVAFYSWSDLGIDPPDGPVVVGPEARHPFLRALSND